METGCSSTLWDELPARGGRVDPLLQGAELTAPIAEGLDLLDRVFKGADATFKTTENLERAKGSGLPDHCQIARHQLPTGLEAQEMHSTTQTMDYGHSQVPSRHGCGETAKAGPARRRYRTKIAATLDTQPEVQRFVDAHQPGDPYNLNGGRRTV
jgi:hypothetical protein